MAPIETPSRIEPARLEEVAEPLADLAADIAAASAMLGDALHPRTAAQLAGLVRIMNTYYSNLIEGHNTRPREIERALAGDVDRAGERRDLQIEAMLHVRVQERIDAMAATDELAEPASREFVLWLHREFYRGAPDSIRRVGEGKRAFLMQPGAWRSKPQHDNAVGRHMPPPSSRVDAFMDYFETRYRMGPLGKAARILAIPAAHHRFNYIHPFPDGNGRVSRLMSHAMAHRAGIGAHGLWSVSRGLARGLDSGPGGRGEYKLQMDHADAPRQGDLDGRGNLSLRALIDFSAWFLKTSLDQILFMQALFEIDGLGRRFAKLVQQRDSLKAEAARLLEEAFLRGEFDRGDASRITGLPARTAQRVLRDTIDAGLLASDTPKGPVSLRFPSEALEVLFPRLYPPA